jgi:hypothetical protein
MWGSRMEEIGEEISGGKSEEARPRNWAVIPQ